MKKLVLLLAALLALMLSAAHADVIDLQILATSDLHGKFLAWDYALDAESTRGSMAQLATALKELRTENSLLLDAGDTIQGNSAALFLDQEVHPMVAALNLLGYDAWTAGNHDFNYGIDTLKNVIAQLNAQTVLGNVWDANGDPLAPAYTILERAGLKIGIVGMVTPHITKWDGPNLAGCTVTNPVEECRKIVDELDGQVDVLIALVHMGVEDELDTPDTGCRALAEACPEFDLIIASHDHEAIAGIEVNGVLIVENKDQAQTMNEIHLTVERDDTGCRVTGHTSRTITLADYAPDEAFTEALSKDHTRAIESAHKEIGVLEGGNLAPESEINGIPAALTEDTALIDLINNTQLRYSGAKVSAAAMPSLESTLNEGTIRACDVSLIYKYENTLYMLEMNGRQLKQYMEWSARFFPQYQEGDLTFSYDPSVTYFSYDMFQGVNYKIDISQPIGSRIVDLTWPDGTPVADDEVFTIAVNNYRANSQLLTPGIIFAADDMPVLVQSDIRSDLGGLRELITDNIVNGYGGILTPECDHNWSIIGNDWDPELHAKAVEQLNSGTIPLLTETDKFGLNAKAITVADLK